MTGPKNTQELRDLLTSRQFPADPPGAPQKAPSLQTPSDRMREKAVVFGEVLFALVPDGDYHALVGNVLHDLVVIGEAKICQAHGVETEHADLRTQGLRATSLGEQTLAPAKPRKGK